jgi:hypothetical protein
MTWSVDGRVLVVFGAIGDAGPDDALLIEGDAAVPSGHAVARFTASRQPHRIGCACCAGRGEAAMALGAIFLARARGEVAFFRRVVAVVSDIDAMRATLADDKLVSGRFRLV